MRWLVLSCFALAGFSPPHGQNAGPDKPVTMQAGLWESTIALTIVDVPGLPKEQLVAMRQPMSAPRTESQCLSPEQAANPLNSLAHQGSCNLARSIFSRGTIDIAGSCLQPNQGKSRIAMTGTYTANAFTARFQVESRFAQPGVEGSRRAYLAADLHGRRTGRCPGQTVIRKLNGDVAG